MLASSLCSDSRKVTQLTYSTQQVVDCFPLCSQTCISISRKISKPRLSFYDINRLTSRKMNHQFLHKIHVMKRVYHICTKTNNRKTNHTLQMAICRLSTFQRITTCTFSNTLPDRGSKHYC